MIWRLQFRRYRLPFRQVVRTAHGPWAEREGLIVRVESEAGEVGFGEAAPLPQFGTERVDEDESAARVLGEQFEASFLTKLPVRVACLRHALVSAIEEASGETTSGPDYLPVAALLPAGRAALQQVAPRVEMGFRTFKWKVGVGDIADELALLDDLCGALPSGARLRLDANGAWDRRKAGRWLERCADRPIEFVEQPIAATDRGEMDLLVGLAGDYPTRLALDESLVGERDLERWIGAGWHGVYIIKPALLANPADALARLAKARAAVVFSSALETGVGARAGLRCAFAWRAEEEKREPKSTARALGYGVWPLFAESRCDALTAAPFIRREDVDRLQPEEVWNALI